jgi:glutamine---fructose-6-phosphate transaminase (isomerizing)
VYLEDRCVVGIQGGDSKITDAGGSAYPAKVMKVSWDYEASDKGSYDKFMAKEIHEQPGIIAQTLKCRVPGKNGNVVLEDVHLSPGWIKNISKITIVSCGTAYYAGLVGKYLLERYLSVPIEVVAASEYRYRPHPEKWRSSPTNASSLLIAVSQSGETADTLAGVRDAKANGCKVLVICNVVGSTMTRESDNIIYTHAGPEISVASTKAYTAQLLAFQLLTLHLARCRGELTSAQAKVILRDLRKVPRQMEQILKEEAKVKILARKFSSAKSIFYLGRGFNYATAMEGALKNKEISYMHAEGYPAGELKHGPIAMIDSEFPVVCICTKSATYDKMISNIREVEARNGRIIILASAKDKRINQLGEDVFYVPETTEEISPILNILPLQLLAYHIARLKGRDIDRPRNLAKSVTVE